MIVAAFALTLLASQQSGASTPPATANPVSPATGSAVTATTTASPPAEQVCRRQPIEGSRRQERVCHTQAEWDALRANARGNRDSASRIQREGF